MTPDNVLVWRSSGRRQCRACQAVTQANPPVHAVVASLDKIKADLSRGVSIAEMMKRQKINTRPFYHFRTLNPDFDRFRTRGNAEQGRASERPCGAGPTSPMCVKKTTTITQSVALILERNPHRDDIVARIFEDLLSGTLKREDVRCSRQGLRR